MNISGKCKLFRKDFDNGISYSTTISNKNIEGKYEHMYVIVQMPKYTILEDKTNINITNGFLSNYKDKNGLMKIKLVVLDYDIESEEKPSEYTQDDLPF